MNFLLPTNRVMAMFLFYVEGYVAIWLLNNIFALPISNSIFYFFILQLCCVWFNVFSIAYTDRNKEFDNIFYGQKMILGVIDPFVNIVGLVTIIFSAPLMVVLVNLNDEPTQSI